METALKSLARARLNAFNAKALDAADPLAPESGALTPPWVFHG